ncbi:MAG: hypothetical protein CVU06_08955 [Bacteroidetes bacterium HGW-Bacteroidetes-22]|nr:MAG: hypothetical protein CVU06_08955 [Bacteroidetes bacterium HGW-Bacteroidetes-22]
MIHFPHSYKGWNVQHPVNAIHSDFDWNLRVGDDAIIATCDNAPCKLNRQLQYQSLPQILTKKALFSNNQTLKF